MSVTESELDVGYAYVGLAIATSVITLVTVPAM